MKKLLLSITALALTTGLFAQEKNTEATKAPGKKVADVAKFTSETIDLGKIKQDNPTTATFEVTNISSEPLLIEQASPTCGCTISDYTKEPIAPGKTGIIKATYNAKNLNMFEKHLTVKFHGVDEIKSITIKGEVIKNETAAAPTETKAAAAPVTEEKVETAATAPVAAPAATAKKETKPATKPATPAKTTTKAATKTAPASQKVTELKPADTKKP